MLSLLAPAALAGALLLAIPVAIHLFKPRKVRVTAFSSLRWLNLSKQKLARRIQWHQLLLFLVRAAFILLLVFALAKPLFTPGGQTAGVDRFVILDVSRSMGYQSASASSDQPKSQSERQTPLDRAKTVAANLLSQSRADDRVTLILTSGRSRALGPLVRDSQAYLNQLSTLTVTQGQTDLSSALQTIGPMLPLVEKNRLVELHFLTDNHLQSWNQGVISQFMQDIHRPVTVNIVDVSSPNASNAYIAQVKRVIVPSSNPSAPPGLKLRVSVGYAGIGQAHRKVRLDSLKGTPIQTQEVSLETGTTQWLEFPLPAGFDTTDQIARFTLDPADGLPGDDTAYIQLDSQAATQILLVDGGSAQGPSNKDALHLRAAVHALALASQGSMNVTRRNPNQLTPQDIDKAQVILLANVPSLSAVQLDTLRHRVRMGAGLAIFLGPQVDRTFYNNGFFNLLQPADSLIPWKLGTLTNASLEQGQLPGLTDVQWSSPLLESLYDPILGDLPQTRFFKQFQIEEPKTDSAKQPPAAAAVSSATVLARIGGSVPAIINQPMGAGKVLLLNMTADDAWTDLPRRRSFVPFVDQMIHYLAGGQIQHKFEVLTPIAIMLPPSADAAAQPAANATSAAGATNASASPNSYTAVGPDAVSYAAVTQQVGTRTLVRLDGVNTPGVYQIRNAAGKPVTTFIAHVGLGDSRISSADTQMIRNWWEPAALTVLTPKDAIQDIQSKTAVLKLWPWLIALGAALLLIEMFLVHRLCPRMNPTLATSVVQTQKGIIAPLESASARSVS